MRKWKGERRKKAREGREERKERIWADGNRVNST
jgi:hypothetical protein